MPIQERSQRLQVLKTPDRTTALMAAQVIANLIRFAKRAGLTPEETLSAKTDSSRFEKLIRDRKRKTRARRRSRFRRLSSQP